MNKPPEPAWVQDLKKSHADLIVTEPAVLDSHGRDWTRFRAPAPAAIAFPGTSEQVQSLIRFAVEHDVAVVPSGGRTGLSGGAMACESELVISLDRMRRILEFNEVDRSITVEAGVVTAAIQQAAADHGLYYPVSFASEGSSQIGGNIATNAGGIRVLRYGMTRDQVTGLKAVTGKGELIDCNRGLVKNATGYDFRHLMIGSEGTLGIIVEATLQLAQTPPASKVLFLAISDLDALMQTFAAFRQTLTLSAFEFLTDISLHHVRIHNNWSRPLESASPLYVILEFDCAGQEDQDAALACFERCVEAGWVADGLMSQSDSQAADLWRYREGISEAISSKVPYKNDLAVRVSKVPDFLKAMEVLVEDHCPDFEVLWYGHIGDGNLHMNILKPDELSVQDFERKCHDLSALTYAVTHQFGGTFSAEHGIGLLKTPWLEQARSNEEITLMRQLKQVFDPKGIFNPGKLLRET